MPTTTSTTELDRSDLLACYGAVNGPVTTVYVPAPSDRSDAEDRFDIHRKNVESDLAEVGADDATVERITDALDGHEHHDGTALVIVADAERTHLDLELDRPVARTTIRLQQLPALLPLLAVEQIDRDHLVVILDRSGADVLQRSGVQAVIGTMEVDGPDVRLHRSSPGGWSQKRFQQTAENAWENNAKEVVDQVVETAGDITTIVVAGDERAVGFFLEHLPERFDAHTVDGSRHAGPDAVLDQADVVLRDLAADTITAELDRFRSAKANGSGATGDDALVQLGRGLVDTLLVVDDTDDDDRPTARFDLTVPIHRTDDDHGEASIAPVTDGAVALAAATGATILVVPSVPELERGVAAILRT